MDQKRGILFDLDGVFCISGELIPGAPQAIELLRDKKIPFRVVTNTTTKTRGQLTQELNNRGLIVREKEIISAGQAGVIHLRKCGSPPCYLLISDELKEDYSEFDCSDQKPEYVVVGDRDMIGSMMI